jgi:uncharacterized protein YndB with AHSA1/START domain
MSDDPKNQDPRAVVRVDHHFDSAIEQVFDAWLDPSQARKFLFATPTGEMVRVEIDARVGGRFCLVDRRDGEDIEHVGEYLDIARPRRLVFSFAVPRFSAEFTRVVLDFEAAQNGCDLRLTHTGVLPEYADGTARGWTGILEGLAATIG